MNTQHTPAANGGKKIEDYLHLYMGAPCDYESKMWGKKFCGEVSPNLLKCTGSYVNIVPHLRPLASLTKDETELLYDIIKNDDFAPSLTDVGLSPDGIRFLLNLGIDLFGLIPAGLALDATTLDDEGRPYTNTDPETII